MPRFHEGDSVMVNRMFWGWRPAVVVAAYLGGDPSADIYRILFGEESEEPCYRSCDVKARPEEP